MRDSIQKVFSEYLEAKGQNCTAEAMENLIEIYEDCQTWNGDRMTTGTTEVEMIDFIKHTREI